MMFLKKGDTNLLSKIWAVRSTEIKTGNTFEVIDHADLDGCNGLLPLQGSY